VADSFTVLATNAYRRTDSGWRLVLHHASPSPRPAEEDDALADQFEPDDSSVTLH